MKGFCVDCKFIRQEWVLEGKTQKKLMIDRYCDICDIFKRADGYCDLWEPK